MRDFKKLFIGENASIRDGLKIIDQGACKIALVVDECETLLGTLTDGDLRRAILSGMGLDDSVASIYNKKPVTCNQDISRDELITLSMQHNLYQIPQVDNLFRVVGLVGEEDYLGFSKKENTVVIMAGGLGERLRPLTEKVPKPMLTVGKKPILEMIIDGFKKYHFNNFIISVNYKSEIIKQYFGDGSSKGVNIKYIDEDKRLGTAGAISLMMDQLHPPFFVINGDIVTNLDFQKMYDYHVASRSEITVALKEYEIQVPYGVVEVSDTSIRSIVEKPVQKFFINAGIYIISENIAAEIPKDIYFDMPSLLNKILNANKKIIPYSLKEYWIDIGRLADYHKANSDYQEYKCLMEKNF